MANSTVTTLEDEPVSSVAAATLTPQVLKGRLDATLSGKRKMLTIHAEKGEGGDHAVFMSLNEFPYQVPRGKPCNVPAELVEIMDNAVVESYERDEGNGRIVTRRTPRFAYSVQDAPDQVKATEAKAKAKAVA